MLLFLESKNQQLSNNMTDHLGDNHHIPAAERFLPFTVKNGLKIDETIFTQGFVDYCNIDKCGGGCCHSGVYADTHEYERILNHKDKIAAVMDETQDTDPAHWFDGEWIDDTDFASGRATGTAVHDRDGGISGFTEGCVFLDKRHFCSIQVAAAQEGLHRWAWKPDYCILFPVTVVEGTITYDDSHSVDLNYCGPDGKVNYVHSVFEAMKEELQHFLGTDDFNKLNDFYLANRSRFEAERLKNSLVQIKV
jgi:Fe-S-cluster containining protein